MDKHNRGLVTMISLARFMLWYFIFDAAFVYAFQYTGLSIFSLGGIYILPFFSILCIFGTLGALINKNAPAMNDVFMAHSPVWIAITLVCYLCVLAPGFRSSTIYSSSYYFAVYVAPILASALALVAGAVVPQRRFPLYFVIFGASACIFGALQILTGRSIIELDASSRVTLNSLEYLQSGNIRASSIFTSGFNFGCFLSLLLCIALASRFISPGLKCLLIISLGWTSMGTLTRNSYIAFIIPLSLSLCWIYLPTKIIRFFPYLMLAFVIAGDGLARLLSSSGGELADDSTLQIRFETWKYVWQTFENANFIDKLTGTLLLQTEDLFIDNVYFGYLGATGAIGVILLLLFYDRLWLWFISRPSCTLTKPSSSVLFLSMMPATSMFNLTCFYFWYVAFISLSAVDE